MPVLSTARERHFKFSQMSLSDVHCRIGLCFKTPLCSQIVSVVYRRVNLTVLKAPQNSGQLAASQDRFIPPPPRSDVNEVNFRRPRANDNLGILHSSHSSVQSTQSAHASSAYHPPLHSGWPALNEIQPHRFHFTQLLAIFTQSTKNISPMTALMCPSPSSRSISPGSISPAPTTSPVVPPYPVSPGTPSPANCLRHLSPCFSFHTSVRSL